METFGHSVGFHVSGTSMPALFFISYVALKNCISNDRLIENALNVFFVGYVSVALYFWYNLAVIDTKSHIEISIFRE